MTNMERFSSIMNEKNRNSVLHSNDAQNAYTAFHNEFFDVYNTCFPVKVFKWGYRNRKPWLSDGMQCPHWKGKSSILILEKMR